MKTLPALWALLILPLLSLGQIQKNPATWSFSLDKPTANAGDIVTVRIKAVIDDGWYVYSNDFDPNLGPNIAVVTINPSADCEAVGKATPVGAKEKYEEIWPGNVRYFTKEALFLQKVKIKKAGTVIAGNINFSTCSTKDGTCLPPADAPFELTVQAGAATAPASATATKPLSASITTATAVAPTSAETDTAATVPNAEGPSAAPVVADPTESLTAVEGTETDAADGSLWAFVLTAFLSGLVALLTPCVFPIIPMTVSFFTNQKGGAWKALLYGLSIIGIYVLIGTIVSRINGPAFANFVSTHWLPNVLFFAVFFVFGLSFLGLFEIVLPSSLVNKADAQAERGGVVGILFMAFTLVLVSFSCTGPIVGSLLVASAGGEVIKPIVGMAAFSSAFAIPFTLFALFPQWLKSLPKSGGWLNSVKVVLGFLELALALKFLSIADQVYHWGLLDREVFLAFWVVIFALIGFYLLGKIRLPHDSETKMVSVPRLLLAILTFAFVVYMVPGLWGAPLKALAGYLPPETSQDFKIGAAGSSSGQLGANQSASRRHGQLFSLPHGLNGFFDYKEALAYAKTVNKPVFIDFTGHGCVNCREMEARVWSEAPVLSRLQNDYVVVALYVDDKTELPPSEWYTSTYDQKEKKTIGAQNADLQIVKYNNNAQPHYCLVDHEGNLLVRPKNYDLNADNFAKFLDAGKAKFAEKG
ncbi:disulfide bond formation protein DsbD [Rudanella paleaurantiibacter]|uniref:Disulfide bond formation protein DsbD n=1 Tax=Rudanella paleaurantiibacter TaxID=2614655 RepID=A0A7J5U2F3_9BACT|nr:cytochrome c biogenesis protein CcdA [Rudanella paleaurantiibacter]KAB7731979.1 disulfide bond formation protein DsbD [Rudanella paleaurantiibacter]